jgi:dTMP kinase
MQKTKRPPDRMEEQSDAFYEAVRAGYHELAQREPDRIVLLDGSVAPGKIEEQIWSILSTRFPDPDRKSKIKIRKS